MVGQFCFEFADILFPTLFDKYDEPRSNSMIIENWNGNSGYFKNHVFYIPLVFP